MSVKALIEKYHTNRKSYLASTYNETQVRNEFLDPFFELLGWDIKNSAMRSTNEREVLLEEALKGGIAQHSKKPDYTFRLYAERKFFLEAKKPSVAIEVNNETAQQVRRYGFTAKLKISVLSNFEYLLIYDCSHKVDPTDNYQKALIRRYHYTEYEEKFDEIKSLIGREAVYTGAFDEIWSEIESRLKTFSVDNLFLSQINQWRILLAEEIFKYQPDISNDLLNDYVQSYLNRILFLRVCEDRNIEQYQTLLSYADSQNFEALVKKFEEADKKFNSGLFDQFLSNQIIENVSSVFWTIIKQLYFPESPYSFTVFSSDILGNIYEIFLSERLKITQEGIKLEPKPENIDRDIITTPTYIIHAILKRTVLQYCQGKSDDEIFSFKFADIACGSGAFLLELYQLLIDHLVDYYLVTSKMNLIQTGINTYKLTFDIKRKILINCIYGTDKDFNAVEAAKFGLLLKLLEEETEATLRGSKSPFLPSLSNNIHYGNSLIGPNDVSNATNAALINPFDYSGYSFDVIVGNPPYMKSEDMKNITPLELPIYKHKYKSAYKQFDKYFLFIEQGISLLKEGGVLGYIVPSKFYKVGAGKELRKYLTSNQYLKAIVSFGANQIFADKTTYTCLLFLSKSKNVFLSYSEVKKLNEWKAENFITSNIDEVMPASLDNDGWALTAPELRGYFENIISISSPLEDIIGADNIYNGIQTSANKIYIFIPKAEDAAYYYFDLEGHTWKIEKEFTRPYFKTAGGDENLYTYRPFKPNSRVIYPYYRDENNLLLYSLDEIKIKFPAAYDYLIFVKPQLSDPKRDIKPTPTTDDEWYRYGRHQSLESCDVPAKLIVGVLSQGNKYAIDYFQTLISSGGTAGYCMITIPVNCSYSIYYIQALLNSKYLEWFSSIYGEVFRGGYIARGTKILKRLPIRTINFADENDMRLHDTIAGIQKQLISLQGSIDENKANPRDRIKFERQFAALKGDLDNNLKLLFGLGLKDDGIPLIKEIYS